MERTNIESVRVKVVNRHAHAAVAEGAVRVYIGRGSPLGNPFKVKPYGPFERGETIEHYRAHLRERLAEGGAVAQELRRLRGILNAGSALELECFCKPRACHGDVVREALVEGWGLPPE